MCIVKKREKFDEFVKLWKRVVEFGKWAVALKIGCLCFDIELLR